MSFLCGVWILRNIHLDICQHPVSSKKKLGSYSWHQIYDNIHSREEIPTIILKADIHRIYQVIYALKKSKVGDKESWEESFDL